MEERVHTFPSKLVKINPDIAILEMILGYKYLPIR